MRIIDLVREGQEDEWDDFINLVEFARYDDNIRNAHNYVGLEEEVLDYEAFHVLFDDDNEAVGFAGIYNGGIYPANTARVLNRAYYSPKVRHKSLATHGGNHIEKALFARYVLPEQIRIARDDLGLDGIFFSVEFPMRRKSVETIVKWMNEHHNHGDKWEVLNRLYNTCRGWIHGGKYHHVNEPTCWQNIAMMKFRDGFTLDLPSISVEEWHARFGHTKR
jgi:hypothetical protein